MRWKGQTDVGEAIVGAELAYVLRLKDNQSGLLADVERLFERRLGLRSWSRSR